MASINATSVSVVRPYAGAVNARANAKIAPVGPETENAARTVKLNRPEVERVGPESSRVKPEIHPLNDGPIKPNGVKPAEIGSGTVIDPVDTSGISPRTEAVLQHTLDVLMKQGGISDTDSLSSILQSMIEPLVEQDGVANPKNAAAQYIKDTIAQMAAESDPIGLKGNSASALDLEG